MYDIGLHIPCVATKQRLVVRGKGTKCFDIPDHWPKLQALWEINNPCNKLPDTIFKYWDDSFLKCRCGKPVIVEI